MERTYIGFAARGEVITSTGRHIPFTRGVPVDFESDEVKDLDDDWKTPASKAAKAVPTPEEPSDG